MLLFIYLALDVSIIFIYDIAYCIVISDLWGVFVSIINIDVTSQSTIYVRLDITSLTNKALDGVIFKAQLSEALIYHAIDYMVSPQVCM